MFFAEEQVCREKQEYDEHDDDFGLVFSRFHPYFVEKIPAAQYLYEGPEDDYRRDRITYGISYFTYFHEFYEKIGRPYETAECDKSRYWMPVAQNMVVVGEHKQHITGPQQYVGLHESGEGVVTVYCLQGFFMTVDVQYFLYPTEKYATGACAENVEHHDDG